MLKRWWWVWLVMAGIGPLLGLLIAAAVTCVMPMTYESQAVIKVRPKMVRLDGVAYDSRDLYSFPISDADRIGSRVSLFRVIVNLDLTNQWGMDRETALEKLRGMVTAEEIKGRDVIAIRVRCADKQAAKDIATEVARCYGDYRIEICCSRAAFSVSRSRSLRSTEELNPVAMNSTW
ncbi:MAG: hypothetical protein NTW21_28355 [Verrucomicrobia bacterium]|nr:hypothetical protein [Verrucomicrobiota bacterium]